MTQQHSQTWAPYSGQVPPKAMPLPLGAARGNLSPRGGDMRALPRTPSPDAKLPYLEAPLSGDCPRAVFWTYHWLRDTAELEELSAYRCTKTGQRQVDRNLRLWMALLHSQQALKECADKSLVNLQKAGGLLFAWAGTTVVHNFGVAA